VKVDEDEGTMTLQVYQVQEKEDNKECVYCVCGVCVGDYVPWRLVKE
jgi:hypothetical protein